MFALGFALPAALLSVRLGLAASALLAGFALGIICAASYLRTGPT